MDRRYDRAIFRECYLYQVTGCTIYCLICSRVIVIDEFVDLVTSSNHVQIIEETLTASVSSVFCVPIAKRAGTRIRRQPPFDPQNQALHALVPLPILPLKLLPTEII
jgi:hypothetical protein